MNILGLTVTSKDVLKVSVPVVITFTTIIGFPEDLKNLVVTFYANYKVYFLFCITILIAFTLFMYIAIERYDQLCAENATLKNKLNNAASLLVDSEKLRKMDVVAGIPNELKLKDDINNYFDIRTTVKSAQLIFIDINNFRKINNEYGHLFGDKVIRYIAQHFHTKMRRSEDMYRYPKEGGETKLTNVYRKYVGGDEFVFLIEGEQSDALGFVSRMHNEFANIERNSEQKIGKSVKLSFDAIVIPIYRNQSYEEALKVIGQCHQRIHHDKETDATESIQRLTWYPDDIETMLSKNPYNKESYARVRRLFKVVNINE